MSYSGFEVHVGWGQIQAPYVSLSSCSDCCPFYLSQDSRQYLDQKWLTYCCIYHCWTIIKVSFFWMGTHYMRLHTYYPTRKGLVGISWLIQVKTMTIVTGVGMGVSFSFVMNVPNPFTQMSLLFWNWSLIFSDFIFLKEGLTFPNCFQSSWFTICLL